MNQTGFQQDESGQSLVFVAVSMVAMLAMLALLLDGGLVLMQRRRMQNAADAAALAGARELGLGSDDATILNRITEYAIDRNGADSFEASYYPGAEPIGQGSVPGDTTGVVVVAQVEFPTFFAGAIGMPTFTAKAKSGGQYGMPQALGSLWPLAVKEFDFEKNQPYTLIQDKTGPGGFGWLDWDGPPVGVPELADNLEHPGNSGVLDIGDEVRSAPGNMGNSQPVRDALDDWLEKPESARHVTLLIYDYTTGGGANLKYHISAFAEFTITGYDYGSGKHNGECEVEEPPGGICGVFINWVEPTAKLSGPGGEYGVSGVRFFIP